MVAFADDNSVERAVVSWAILAALGAKDSAGRSLARDQAMPDRRRGGVIGDICDVDGKGFMVHAELAGGSAKLLSGRDLAPISLECPTRSACSTTVTIGSTDRKDTPCARLFFLSR